MPTGSGDRWPEDYERGRPGYPAEVVGMPGLPADSVVLDLGAGTGKLTRLLVAWFARVVAVDPAEPMRRLLATRCPEAEVFAGSAEEIPLADGAVDAVFAAEAFHWFDGQRALAEIARVLRPRGALVLMWNLPAGPTEPSTTAVDRIVEERAPRDLEYDPGDLNSGRYASGEWRAAFAGSSFEKLQEARLPNSQILDRDGFVAFLASMGWVADLPDADRLSLLGEIRSLLGAHEYRRPWETHVCWTRVQNLAPSDSASQTSGVNLPETRFARSGEVNIAYQVVGDGTPDLVYAPAISHLELGWESPSEARFRNRIASICRLIMLNQRGTGMSDRVASPPTLEMRMDDIRAVMDAARSERAVVFGLGDAGPLCALFAATYPERTSGLILMNSSPRFVRSPSFPWLPTRGETEQRADDFERRWGEPVVALEFVRMNNPSASEEELRSSARVFRLSVSPGAAAAYVRMNIDVDVCDVLTLIRVPTLVMHRKDGGGWNIRSSRALANLIPGADLVELPGADFQPQFGDQESLFTELEGFLERVVQGKRWEVEPDRVLATVLFTDIVGSTAKAAELGDAAWRELLQRHHDVVRRELARFRGHEMDTAGDGFFATFDGPARAIRCAWAVRDGLGELGLDIRAGLHTGECELLDEKVGGIAVHIGARVTAQAQSGEVLVSSTVKDLVAGSGIGFRNRGAVTLKGLPGEWSLYAVREVPTPSGPASSLSASPAPRSRT